MMKISKFNKVLLLFVIIIALIYIINPIKEMDIYNILIVISIIPVSLFPFLLEKYGNIKIPNFLITLYMIFILFAYFFGSIVGLYNKISWYDTVAHFSSGILISFAAYYIYKISSKNNNKVILVLFIVGVTSLIAILWEIFEFVSDSIFKKDAQHVIDTGVNDTMIDMIVALLGSILFSFIYFLESKFSINGIINIYDKEIEDYYGKRSTKRL